MREDPREICPPIHAAGRAFGIGKGHVQRREGTGRACAREETLQALSTVGIDALHERRVAEMENGRIAQVRVVDVVVRERVVRPRAVQKDPVDARRVQHETVGCCLAFHGAHAARLFRYAAELFQRQSREWIVSQLGDQAHGQSQPVQREADIGNGPARGDHRRVHDRQTSRARPVPRGVTSKARDHVETEMSADDDAGTAGYEPLSMECRRFFPSNQGLAAR